jgi:hypothetical protein
VVFTTRIYCRNLVNGGGLDTIALARLYHPEVAAVPAPLIESGAVVTCGDIEFELGWATPEDWQHAVDVQAALWHGGRMRAAGPPDVPITQITGQPVQWVVPRGTGFLTSRNGKLGPVNELQAERRASTLRLSAGIRCLRRYAAGVRFEPIPVGSCCR